MAVGRTNVRIIQADVVYKRGKPFDDQATRNRDVESWQVATAIYERALELAPDEDFYYLFLGRAYLEQSALSADPAQQADLLNTAERRLLRAQTINPLNTDHTANLARLNTRWWQLSATEAEKQERVATAEDYYQDALSLSPQNSVIRNEYARLSYDLLRDCVRGRSVCTTSRRPSIPIMTSPTLCRADVYVTCAADAPDATRADYYARAVSSLEEGLALNEKNALAWLQAAQLYQELGRFDDALAAYDQTRALNDGQIPIWNLDFLVANLYLVMADEEMALALAEQALTAAPPEAQGQVQQFINQLTGGGPAESMVAAAFLAQELVPLTAERPLATLNPADRDGYYESYPPRVIDVDKTYEALIITEKGEMRLRLFDDEAPLTVNNFVYLASQGFYDGTTFHRVLVDFMAQGWRPRPVSAPAAPATNLPMKPATGCFSTGAACWPWPMPGQEPMAASFLSPLPPRPGLMAVTQFLVNWWPATRC